MARDFAVIRCAIWSDEDWRQLSDGAQNLYLKLLSDAGLSFCGVTSYYPKRLAVLTRGATAGSIDKAAGELEQSGHVVIDRDTDEVLIRSFIRHDGILTKPNIAIAMAKNYHGIVSLRVRRAFVRELLRLRDDEAFSDRYAWSSPKVAALLDEPSEEPISDTIPKGSTIPSAKGSTPTTTSTSTTTPTSTSAIQPLATEIAAVERPDVEALCGLLADLIESNGSKRPTVTGRWHDAARLMLDRDGHTYADVEGAIRFSQADEFWRTNILGMPKLRDQYDRLRLAASRRPASTRSTTDDRVNGWLALAQTPTQPGIFGEIA